jgi:hypothetical protein
VLGKRYPEGPDALGAVLHDLAVHPATARFVATKLARHFVADTPPPALVERLAAAFLQSSGDLPTVYRALVRSPEAWAAEQRKLKTPAEFVVSSVRLLGLSERLFARGDGLGVGTLGQRLLAAPSPAGWSDRADDWLGPDAVWKRVEWSTRIADRVGRLVDARALAVRSLGPLLDTATHQQIDRAGRWTAGARAAADGARVPASLTRAADRPPSKGTEMTSSIDPRRRFVVGTLLGAGALAPWSTLSLATTVERERQPLRARHPARRHGRPVGGAGARRSVVRSRARCRSAATPRPRSP